MEMARAAASRSASSRTMHGSLPPSSSVTFFKPSAARAMTLRPVREPCDVLAESLRLDARLEERLALLLREDLRDLLDLGQHVACGLVQYLGALVGRQLRPCGERLCRRVRRAVHVRDVAEWNL